MSAKTVEEFDAVFRADPDPWNTLTNRDEAVKRAAILRGLGRTQGRVLELACGNGSNTVELESRSLRLTAVDGAQSAVELTCAKVGPRTRVRLARLPDGVPRGPFHACVIAEVLYYLPARDIAWLGRRLARELAPGATLVLAHHHVDFSDTASSPARCHARLLNSLAPRVRLDVTTIDRTRRWRVERVLVN